MVYCNTERYKRRKQIPVFQARILLSLKHDNIARYVGCISIKLGWYDRNTQEAQSSYM